MVGSSAVVRKNHTAKGDSAEHVDGNNARRLLLLFDERLLSVLFRLAIAAQILDLVLRETTSTNEYD